jgi:prephenate dehydrogenase
MEKFHIGIVGGTGGIGKWFASFFERHGYTVYISGRSSGMTSEEMGKACRVVMVSVPIENTLAAIEKIGPHMPPGSLLADLTSLKIVPVRAMLDSSVSEVIGLHPLFGPGEPSVSGLNIAFCPARGNQWLCWVKEIFENNGARLIETTPEEHDAMMAFVQGLNHFNTAIFAMTLKDSGITLEKFRRFSTPVFVNRLSHIEKICSNPRLYASILTSNSLLAEIIVDYRKNLSILMDFIEAGDSKSLETMLRDLVKQESIGSSQPD